MSKARLRGRAAGAGTGMSSGMNEFSIIIISPGFESGLNNDRAKSKRITGNRNFGSGSNIRSGTSTSNSKKKTNQSTDETDHDDFEYDVVTQ